MQEAYRPPCIEYSFCCPTWVPPPPCPDLAGGRGGTWPGYPPGRVPPCPDLARGEGGYLTRVPPSRVPPGRVPPPVLTWLGGEGLLDQGTPWQGTPPAGYPPPVGPGRVPPQCLPHGILGNVTKHYGIWVPPLWTDRWKDRHVSKHYLPVVLHMRVVNICFVILLRTAYVVRDGRLYFQSGEVGGGWGDPSQGR